MNKLLGNVEVQRERLSNIKSLKREVERARREIERGRE